MSWCWLALLDEPPANADAAAHLSEPVPSGPADRGPGAPAGVLVAWFGRRKPVPHALRADGRIVDPHGGGAVLSLVLPPRCWRIKFDDVAVQQARRDVLARPPADAVTTLLFDATHFAGSLTVERTDPGHLRDDPFARIFPARVLHAGPGLLGRVPTPCGPTIERHGSANPWPWPSF